METSRVRVSSIEDVFFEVSFLRDLSAMVDEHPVLGTNEREISLVGSSDEISREISSSDLIDRSKRDIIESPDECEDCHQESHSMDRRRLEEDPMSDLVDEGHGPIGVHQHAV